MIILLYNFICFLFLISGILLITIWNPIYKIIYLIALFFFGSSIFLILDFYFLGLTYFIVYIGAIIILFLFIIMMVQINISSTENFFNLSYHFYSTPLILIAC
jgi:NADH:ubiquinone oxidoreductase subunit 6 (subunit J)